VTLRFSIEHRPPVLRTYCLGYRLNHTALSLTLVVFNSDTTWCSITIYFFSNHFCALGRRCGQPGQQQGLLFPLSKSSLNLARCFFLVSAVLTIVVQQIHSLWVRGVRLFHFSSRSLSAVRTFFMSEGSSCSASTDFSFLGNLLIIKIYLIQFIKTSK